VIGINGILPAVKEIESGNLLASRRFQHVQDRLHGNAAPRCATINPRSLPDKVILPAEVIDKSNYKGLARARGVSGAARNGAEFVR